MENINVNYEYKIDFNKEIFNNYTIPVIDINIFNTSYSFILDSGANLSIIDEEFFKEISSTYSIESVPEVYELESVGGSMEGKSVIIPVTIGTDDFELQASVTNIKRLLNHFEDINKNIKGILATHVFKYLGWKLDFKNGILWK